MSVYFVQAGVGGRIKIGYSPYPDQRVAYLRRYSGPDLIALAVIEGPRGLESALHKLLAAYRAHDEWFEPVEPVLDVVRRAAARPQQKGDHQLLFNATFTDQELDAIIARDGCAAAAARVARQDPYSYVFAVLEGMLWLFPEERP